MAQHLLGAGPVAPRRSFGSRPADVDAHIARSASTLAEMPKSGAVRACYFVTFFLCTKICCHFRPRFTNTRMLRYWPLMSRSPRWPFNAHERILASELETTPVPHRATRLSPAPSETAFDKSLDRASAALRAPAS